MGTKESEERYRIAMKQPGDGIALLRGELYANRRFLDILGWDASEGGAGEDASLIDITRGFGSEKSGYETTGLGKDGTPIHVEISRTNIDFPGGPAVLICVRDVTEQKRTENEKAMLESRLRQSIETFGAFADRLSHDFNNILTALVGYGSLLKARTGSDKQVRTYVDQIVVSSEKAAALVRNLPGGGKEQPSLEPSGLNDIVKGALKSLLSGGVELSIKLADENPVIRADVSQLEECVAHLAADVRDAMPEEGYLRIETGTTTVEDDPTRTGEPGRGRYAVLSISCAGNKRGKAKNVREPFAAWKEIDRGAALRLAVAYATVRRHEGCIAFLGAGLRIYLPLISESEQAGSALATEGGHETLLLAEDDSTVRGLITEVLQVHGYTVLEAADGEDAIHTFIENRDRIKLLLLDVDMPKKNGKEVYEYLRKTYPGIKVIFVTGGASEIVIDHGAKDARIGFLPKPVSAPDLINKIREVLEDRL